MANQENVTRLLQGYAGWNRWRKGDSSIRPDLMEADLSGANLSYANLYRTNLREANLSEANLSESNLSYTYLYKANLRGANLRGADLSGANLSGANLSGANLSEADLSRALLGSRSIVNSATRFASQNLTGVKNLHLIQDNGLASIDFSTVTLPPMSAEVEIFLRRTGQSDYLIQALWGKEPPLANISVKTVLNYIESDQEWAEALRHHLTLIKHLMLTKNMVPASPQKPWASNTQALTEAHLIVLLVSAPFLSSSLVQTQVLRPALEHQQQGATLVPVLLRPTEWQESSLQGLQPLPINGNPVTQWTDRDVALHDIALGLRPVVQGLHAQLRVEGEQQRQRDLLLARLIQTRTGIITQQLEVDAKHQRVQEAEQAVSDAEKLLREVETRLKETRQTLEIQSQHHQVLQQSLIDLRATETELVKRLHNQTILVME